jgi:hypothetical protein
MAGNPKNSDRLWLGGLLVIPLALVLTSGSFRCAFSAHSPVVWRVHEFRNNYDQAKRSGIGDGKWTRAMIAFNATVLEQPKKRCTS